MIPPARSHVPTLSEVHSEVGRWRECAMLLDFMLRSTLYVCGECFGACVMRPEWLVTTIITTLIGCCFMNHTLSMLGEQPMRAKPLNHAAHGS